MTTKELLALMRLLSALESAMLAQKITFPDYLHEQISETLESIEREICAERNLK